MRSNKNKSIVRDIYNLQIGLHHKNVHHYRCKLLKNLVCSPTRVFQRVQTFHTRGPSMFTLLHCGRIYRWNEKNNIDCFSAYERRTEQTPYTSNFQEQLKLFSFSEKSQCKDLIVWSPDSPLTTLNLLANKDRHSTSLLYVTSSGYLIRRCALTGQIKNKIFLSSRVKFTELQCDPECDRVVLKSTKHQHTFITFAVFSSPPLQFTAMFEISKSLFGIKAVDAGIQQGILFVRHSDNKVKLYSLEYILTEFTENIYKLGDELKGVGKIGQKTAGLPLTVNITHEPPVLMEVITHQGDFIIGANPWHYISRSNMFESAVYNLCSDKLVAKIDTPKFYLESELVFFHPDDSNRLVHISNDSLKVSWIHQNSLHSWLQYDPPTTTAAIEVNSQPKTSRYGRTLKPIKRSNDEEELIQDLSLTYDEATNLLGLLRASEKTNSSSTVDEVLFFDNETGNIAKTVSLDQFSVETPFDVTSFNILLDGPQFLVISRYQNLTYGLLYSLIEHNTLSE